MTETIKGSVVLITGATGAIAQALIAGLAARGAAKIYAAARDISFLAASPQLVADQDGCHQRRGRRESRRDCDRCPRF